MVRKIDNQFIHISKFFKRVVMNNNLYCTIRITGDTHEPIGLSIYRDCAKTLIDGKFTTTVFNIPVVTSQLTKFMMEYFESMDENEDFHTRLLHSYFYEKILEILDDNSDEIGEPGLIIIQTMLVWAVMATKINYKEIHITDEGYKIDDGPLQPFPTTGSELANWNPKF